MDAWQIVVAVLAAAGGGPGVSQVIKIIRGQKQPPTVREYRNSEIGQVRATLAEVYENQITQSGTLARIEGTMRSAKSRLDDLDTLVSRLIDSHRDLADDHRELSHRVERLEERDGRE